MSEKKFKFNIIDAIVVIVILALLCFVGYKLVFGGDTALSPDETVTYVVTYWCDEVPEYAVKAIEMGAPLTDDAANLDLGKVTKIEISDSTSYATDAQGVIHLTTKPLYHTVKLESVVEIPKKLADFKYGIKTEGNAIFGVGHTLTFRAGKAKLYGRVSGIEVQK